MLCFDEGECPECGGKLEMPEVENCSCHIMPPCPACLRRVPTCERCGWNERNDLGE